MLGGVYMAKVIIASDGIKKSLKNFTAIEAINEYIWNGFDAGANCIKIETIEDEIYGYIKKIRIEDNGTGIDYSNLDITFTPFNYSEKAIEQKIKNSIVHGKNGVGRFTFFTFCNRAEWITVFYDNNLKSNRKYSISMKSDKLNDYEYSDLVDINESTGTIVDFNDIFDHDLFIDNIKKSIINEFCWFLILNKKDNFKILLNEIEIDYKEMVNFEVERKYNDKVSFSILFISWKNKLDEFSKFYFINSQNKEVFKENTSFNNKGDQFYHSLYIQSNLFDNFDFDDKEDKQASWELFGQTKKSIEFQAIISEANNLIKEYRLPFLKKHAVEVIKHLNINEAFKKYNGNNHMDKLKKEYLENVIECIYVAQPSMFSNLNKDQKNTFIRFLDLSLESGEVDSLYKILEDVIELQPEERKELASMLKYTTLSNIIKTLRILEDRIKCLNSLKELVFNKELNANEVNHLQKFMEENFWILGEEYFLISKSEDSVMKTLLKYKEHLEVEYKDYEIDKKDRYKQFDLLLCRKSIDSKSINNVLVELKHPNIKLTHI